MKITIGTENKNGKLKQLSGGSCVNCYSNSLLPIIVTNEKIQGSLNEVQYSFDMELEAMSQQLSDANITLERSVDGKSFRSVTSAQSSINDKQIMLTDPAAQAKYPYYRAKVMMEGEKTQITDVLYWEPGKAATLTLHPNPVKTGNVLNINTPDGADRIEIRDVTGRIIASNPISSNTSDMLSINTAQLTKAGIYFVTVFTAKDSLTKTFMVK